MGHDDSDDDDFPAADPYATDMKFEYEIVPNDDHSISLIIYPVPRRRMDRDEFAEGIRRFLEKYGLACVYEDERGTFRYMN